MGVTERRAREKEELRRSILDAASKLIVEEGHQNLSIRKIAEKIEYAPSTIYLYFQDKHAILANIAIDCFGELNDMMDSIGDNEKADPLQMLRNMARCYIEFGIANPSYYHVTFLTNQPEDLPADHPLCLAIGQAGKKSFGGLQQALGFAMEAGVIDKDDTNAVAQSVWLALHGLTAGLITMGHDKDFPWIDRNQLIDLHIRMILKGLGAKVD